MFLGGFAGAVEGAVADTSGMLLDASEQVQRGTRAGAVPPDRYAPSQDTPGEPVQHGGEIDGEPCCAIGPSDNGERAPWGCR